jgi:RHS repeat-associated protein
MISCTLWAGARTVRLLVSLVAVFASCGAASAQVAGVAIANRVNGLSGRVEGSVQQNLANGINLNGGAVVTGDLLVLGLPTVTRNGTPTYAGTIDGTGVATPTGYSIYLNSGASLQHVVRRTNAAALTPVGTPASPVGTRSVNIGSAGQSVGSWSTLRNLTLNGGVGQYTVPAGAYGDFIANSGSRLVLGIAGSVQPSIYSFQRLTLNGLASLRVVGPVQIRVGSAVFSNGPIGNEDHPAWLELKIQTGGFTLNSGAWLAGYVFAPTGEVMINSSTRLVGGVECDRLTVNGGGLLRLQQKNQAPVANTQSLVTDEDTAVGFTLTGSDPDGQTLSFFVVSGPVVGSLSGSAPNLTYTPPDNFFGTTSFTFKVNDGVVDSAVATVTIEVRPVDDRPVARALEKTTEEDTSVALTLAGTDVEMPVLTFSVMQQPKHGALSGSGADLVYTPAADYFGPDGFLYVANDGAQDSEPAVVSLTVTPVNDAPVATDLALGTDEDVALPFVLTGSDIEGDALTYRVVSGPANGVLSGSAPALIYRPASDWSGTDELTYVVNDGTVDSALATVRITVRPINDCPVSAAAPVRTREDQAVPVALTAVDVDSVALAFAVVDAPAHGTLTGSASGFVYTPAANYNGPDSFTYTVSDGVCTTAAIEVAITVDPVNDAPSAQPQSLKTPEDTPLAITLTGTDLEDTALGFQILTQPQHGTLAPGASPGLYTYSPANDWSGADSFSFTVSDGELTAAPAIVSIAVTPVNDAPVAAEQTLAVKNNATLSITLSATDSDGDALGYVAVTDPANGTLSGTAPNLVYTPSRSFVGTDSFPFKASDASLSSAPATITISVTDGNTVPVATPQSLTVLEDGSIPVALSGTDADGDPLTYSVLTHPAHGSLSGSGRNYTYTPTPLSRAADSFTFIVNDGRSDSAPATVSITVQPIDHAPSVHDLEISTVEDTPVTFSVPATDADGDPISFRITNQPTHGSLEISGEELRYSPNCDYYGSDQAVIAILSPDGTEQFSHIHIGVLPANDAPVAYNRSETCTEDDSISINLRLPPRVSNMVIGCWNTTRCGENALADGMNATRLRAKITQLIPGASLRPLSKLSDSALIDVDLLFLSVATGDSSSISPLGGEERAALKQFVLSGRGVVLLGENSTYTPSSNATNQSLFSVFGLELDGTGPGLHPMSLTSGALANGACEIVSSANFFWPAWFIQTNEGFTDARLSTNGMPAIVRLGPGSLGCGSGRVVAFSDTSVATDSWADNGSLALMVNALAWATQYADLDEDALSYRIETPPAHGTLSGTAPLLRYTPAPDFNGVDQFTYIVSDCIIDSSPGIVSITITPKNDAPVATPQSLTVLEDGSIPVVPTGTDADGDQLTYSILTPPAHGTLTPAVIGWTYVPAKGYSGNDAFSYRANDGISSSEPAEVHIVVWKANHRPVAESLSIGAVPGIARPVLLTGSDADGDTLTYAVTAMPVHGVLSGRAPTVIYTAQTGFTGNDSFAYTVSDGSMDSSVATVSIDVRNNQAPTVDVGQPLVIPYGYTVTLRGVVSDDGLPVNQLTQTWTSSGPDAVTLASPTSLVTTADFSKAGTYVVRLTVSDSMATAFSEKVITVLPVGTPVTPTITVIPYQATGWRYQIFPSGSVPANVGAWDFDDGDFVDGAGAFGSHGGCALQSTVRTFWPVYTDIVLRRVVRLPENAGNLRVLGTVDNDARIFINGNEITNGFLYHEGCPSVDDCRFNVQAASLRGGDNLVVIHARDRGTESFLDIRLLVDNVALADAGGNVSAPAGATVRLDGSHSTTTSGASLQYQWKQSSGPAVELHGADTVSPSFVMPELPVGTTVGFRLYVTDGFSFSTSDEVLAVVALAPNALPSVQIDTPQEGTALGLGQQIAITATAADADGVVANVVFYAQGPTDPVPVRLAMDLTAPYATTWSPLAVGTYELSAVAMDDDGATAVSEKRAVVVVAGEPPRVALLRPEQGSQHRVARPVGISADAVDSDGVVVRVEFFAQEDGSPVATKIGTATNAPFAIDWTPLSIGRFQLTATATDDTGVAVASAPVVIAILANVPPSIAWISPADGETIGANRPTALQVRATDPDGFVALVEYYVDGAKIGETTHSAVGLADVYELTLASGIPVGTHALSAVVSDSEGATTLCPAVTVEVRENVAPPTVAFVSPLSGASVLANASTTLIARATSSSATITKIEFFRDGTSLGLGGLIVGQTDQYGLTVSSGFPAGTHTIIAKVTDSSGQSTTSAPVTVIAVSDPGIAPTITLVTPTDGASLTAPTPVTGIVSSPILVSWVVNYRLKTADGLPANAWITGASGTASVGTPASGSAAAVPGPLGTFDPTNLLNGQYEIRLRAADAAGRIVLTAPATVVVEGSLKLGALSESFVEVSLPAPGFPLEVIRHYDSRDPRIGDFGVGGTLANADYRLQKSLALGEAWFAWSDNSGPAGFPAYMLDPAPPQDATGVPPAPRTITITLPTDVVYRFSARLSPNRQVGAPIRFGRMVFDPMPGTVGALVPLDDAKQVNDEVMVGGDEGMLGTVDLLDYSDGIYDPKLFRLTLTDGSVYLIDEVLGVLEMTDPNGNRIEYREDGIIHSCGMQLTLVRDSAGCITKVLDPDGNEVRYTYDAQHRLISVTDRAGRVTTLGYSGSSGLVTSVTPPAAVQPTFNVWDGLDRFIGRVDGMLNRMELGLDPAGYKETKKDQLGNVTTYQMDDYGRMLSKIDPLGGVTSYAYGDSLNPFLHTAVTDPLGRVTRYAYNRQGLPTAVTDPLGNVTRYEYNSQGKPTKETDPLGNSVVTIYDAVGNALSVTDRDGAVHSYTYDSAGNVVTATDPLGEKTAFAYSSQGLPLTEETRAADGTLVAARAYAYDIYGNRNTETTKVPKSDGTVQDVTLRHTYDLAGNPLVTTYADGATLVRTYDAAGRLASETDRVGHTTSHEYDAAGRRTKSTFWDGTTETAAYDAKGRTTSVTDRRGFVTATEYDPLDRITKTTLPDGTSTTAVYDLAGQLVTETDAAGNATAVAYDLGGRPTTVTHPDGTTTEVGYDVGGNATEVKPRVYLEAAPPSQPSPIQGRTPVLRSSALRAPAADPAAPRYTFTFDAAHRITGIKNADGTTASIAYDMVGRPTSTTNERGVTWTYEYSDSRAVVRSRVVGPLGYSEKYSVNALACVASRTDALGRTTLFDYPADKYQPSSISYHDGSSESFTYDDQGRQTRMVDRRGNYTDYSYVETSAKGAYTRTTTRLVTVVGSDSPETTATLYTTSEDFDDFGNLFKVVEDDGLGTTRTTTHTYDWANRRTSTTQPDGTVVKTVYGPGGRTESVTESSTGGDRKTSYAYDANGHLTTVTHPDHTTTGYSYAADGRLLSMTDPRGGVTAYTYNDTAHIVYVTDPVGSITTRTYDALGNLLTEKDALGHTTTYAYDDLGRRTGATDALGNKTTYAYDLAGNLLTVTDPLGRVAAYSGYDANNRPTSFALTGSAAAPGSATIAYAYDKVGNRIALTDPLGRKTTFDYDQLSRLYRTRRPSGLAQSTRYDIAGNELARHEYDPVDIAGARTVVQTFDAGNRLLSRVLPPIVIAFGERPVAPVETFAYDGFGRLATHQDVRLATTTYAYDGVTDRVKSIQLPGGGIRSFGYDEMGNPTAMSDARGIVTHQVFDPGQRMTSRSVGGARTTTYGYDAVGNVASVVQPSGQTIANTFDALRRITSQSVLLDAASGQHYLRSFAYDAGGRLLTSSDANGTTTRSYDFQDRVLTADEPLGRSTAHTYNAAGDLLTVTDARGGVTDYAYDSAGRLSSVTDAESGVRSLAFDVFDQLVSEELGGSRVSYDCDLYGRPVRATRSSGSAVDPTSETLWGPTGLLMAVRDQAGNVTRHTYDSRGRRTLTSHPEGSSESFTYDDEGNLLTATDENGHTRSFAYNLFGELASVTDATGAVTAYTYDDGGRVSSITDPTGRKTAYAHDEAGRLKSTTLPDGTSVTAREYDQFGNLTALIEPDGRRALYEYDELNRLVKARVPTAAASYAESRYGYDSANNLTSILDPLSRLSTFTHDKVNRLTAVYLPRSGVTPHERYEYDVRGLPTKRTDAAGYATTMAYDALGRLTQSTPDARRGEPAITYAYDARGLRTRMTDALGTTTYTHDARGRLTSKATPHAGALSYSYDAAGNLADLASSVGGVSTNYTYDAENRLSTVAILGAGTAAPSTSTYTRDLAGRPTATTLPNGVSETRTYDTNGLLASVATVQGGAGLTHFGVTRDASGRVRSLDEQFAAATNRHVDFTYDQAGRLVSESASLDGVTGSLSYSLDAAGNRLARAGQLGTLGVQSFTFDENNALTDGTYDDNGNTTAAHSSEPLGGFSYDFRDALRTRTPALTADAASVEFLHDGDGRRVGRRALDPTTGRWKTTHYLVAELNPTGYDQVLAEVREGSLERSFAYGEQRVSIDGFVERQVRGGRHSLALDASGQVWAWGDNSEGQLGLGTTDGSSDTPVAVPGLNNVAALAAGRFHSIALRNDGTVWVWGGNARGQLGLGAGVSANVPTQIVGLTDVVAIATHLDHTLALTLDGAVWAWGANDRGQLGDGSSVDRTLPVRIDGLEAADIAVGQIHSSARGTDGRIFVWGDNTYGQLGTGATGGYSATPAAVSGLVSADRLASGGFHTLVRRSDGTVLAWGGNAYGQLGDDSKQDRAAPVSIAPAAQAVALAAGSRHSLVLLADGTVLAWGDNREGQLGLGSVADSTVPSRIVGLSGVTEIAAGGRRSLARSGSALLEWGDGRFLPESTGADLSLASLGGESGADPLGYGLGVARAFYAYDPQGNVRALTDDSGSLTDTYTYDAFGNLLAGTHAGGQLGADLAFNPYLFQGERYEAAAGLYHLRARDYDPLLGRFQQLDSFEGVRGQPFSHNRYTYSEADPVNLHDPSGHYAVTVWGAMQLLQQQADYNDFLADIGPKEQLLDLGALTCNYAYVMGPRPQVVQRERPIWLMAAGSGSIVGDLGNESGSVNDTSGGGNNTRGLGAGSSVFFLAQTGAPFRQSVVERMVDSAWVATQRAWPNLNTGPKLPDDFRAKLSVKWQNRWPDVLYHDAILQGALRSALLGREVEAYVTATFRSPSILPKTRSALALKSLAGSAAGGPLDWRAPAASPQGAFLSHISASGWEYGQMEMMQEWTEAVQSSGAYRAAYVWAEVGVRLPGEVALMGASMLPGVGEGMDVHSSVFGETAFERNLARISIGVSVVTGGLSPNFGRIGRAIGEIGGELGRLSRRGVELAGRGTTSALHAAERASLAAARNGARAVGHLAGGARTAGNYAAFERGYLRGTAKYAGQLNSGVDPTPFFHGVLEGAREVRALHDAPRITAEVADTASDLARTERHATAALADAAENAAFRTVYRGDPAGVNVIKSYAAREGGYAHSSELIRTGNLDELMSAHAFDSRNPASPFISVTSDPAVARYFAGPNGVVREFRIPLNRALPNPQNNLFVPAGPGGSLIPEAEFLVPNYIRPSEIVRTH